MGEARKGQNHPTVRVAKAARALDGGIVTLRSGVRARIRPVSAKLLDEVSATVPEPQVPKQYIEAKDREEFNPLDPNYLRDVREANKQRGIRITEALVMFGVELVDPLPEKEGWLPKLRFLEKRGSVDLSVFDLEDPLDLEFVYKTLIAVSSADLTYVAMASGLTEPEVALAIAGFPGEAIRDRDTRGGSKA